MRGERIFGALRRPLNKRVRFRRSTVIMVALFVVLAGLLAYHDETKATPTSATCTSNHCTPAKHNGTSRAGAARQIQVATRPADRGAGGTATRATPETKTAAANTPATRTGAT